MSPDLITDAELEGMIDDAEFELDMRVVEAAAPLVTVMCNTNDGCGNTCATSACSTKANDPF